MELKNSTILITGGTSGMVLFISNIFIERRYICSVNRSVKIASIFPKHLFWDVDMDRLDIRRDKGIIIPRLSLCLTHIALIPISKN